MLNIKIDGDNNNPEVIEVVKPIETVVETPIEEALGQEIFATYGNEYNAKSVDKFGNLLGENGEIVIKYEDLLAKIDDADSKTIIDGKEYKLDDKGNALDETGKVFKTKEEIDIINKPLVQAIEERTNIIIKDESGNVIKYADTEDGLAQRELAVAGTFKRQGQIEGVNNFFEEEPEMLQAFAYFKKHGTFEGLGQPVVWDKLVILKDGDEAIVQHKDLIIKAQLAKGNSIQEATDLAQYAIDNKKSLESATLAVNYLKEQDRVNAEALITEQQSQAIAKQNDELQYQTAIKDIIFKQGKAKDLTINDVMVVKDGEKTYTYTKQDFYNYITQPRFKRESTGEVFTAYEADKMKYEEEHANIVYDALLHFNKHDISKIVKSKVDDTVVKTVKDRMKDYAEARKLNFKKPIGDDKDKPIDKINTNN